ncbi:MAG: hypothetical protein D6741_12110 [Planctomycetota bacterium]|nr:MAG: hypothetical protein D6741_12110 [Planctomycetota bacterium]
MGGHADRPVSDAAVSLHSPGPACKFADIRVDLDCLNGDFFGDGPIMRAKRVADRGARRAFRSAEMPGCRRVDAYRACSRAAFAFAECPASSENRYVEFVDQSR